MYLGPQTQTMPTYQLSSQNYSSVNKVDMRFDELSLNVEPLIFSRPLSSFTRWLIIVCVPKSHPDYDRLQSTIQAYASSIDSGVSTTVSLKDNSYNPGKTISKHKWYSMDLRNEVDTTIGNTIKVEFPEEVTEWYTSMYIDKIYNKCKGLVIYADKIEQIPKSIVSRSIAGVCDMSGPELSSFIHLGSAKYLDQVNPVNSSHKLVGYSNCNKWTKLVTL